MSAKTGTKPNYRVDVLEGIGRARQGAIRCDVGKQLTFETAGLESYFFAEWSSAVIDALLVAASVEFCDRTLRRPSATWGREIELRLPVHNVDLWRSREVSDILVDALDLLTGDRWSIQFRPRKNPEEKRRQGQFTLPSATKAVMPFSDGLDSWAVANSYDRDHPGRLLRVRLGTSAPASSRVATRRPAFAHVPYRVRTGERPTVQSSVRSRGFKFALIAGIAAYLAKIEDIVVPESGQGVLGPVIVPVGQAPDFRCHPRFTSAMEQLILALLGHRVHYLYPRLGHTKGETLRAAVANDPSATGWMQTRTCWQSGRHVSVDGKRRQCGICTACLLRRLSVHSAGLIEPSETYVWENLRTTDFRGGANSSFTKFTLALEQHAIAGTLHLGRLAILESSSEYRNIRNGMLLLSQALRLPEIEVVMQQHSLWRQHRLEWQAFLDWLGPDSFIARWAQAAA
jgi:7-cyano-7-deazaguanine synthase in queuosine biosynthesis